MGAKALPDPLAAIRRPTSKGRGRGLEGEGGGKGRERRGEGEKGSVGRWREGREERKG